MNSELIKINESNGDITVSARELHEFLEIGTEFRHWFPRMCEYGFENGMDYTPVIFEHPQNHQLTKDYAIKLEMAKEIAMIQRNEKGKKARKYFIECEKQLKNTKVDSYMIEDPVERAKRWIEEEEHRRVLSKNIIVQNEIIKELTPKAELADKVLNSRALMTTSVIAQDYGMTAQQLNKLLNTLGVQYKSGKQWLLYSKYKNMELMHSETLPIIRSNGQVVANNKWTMKGRKFIHELLNTNGILNTIQKLEQEELQQLMF